MHTEETSIYYIIWIIVGVLGSLIALYIYSIIKANRVDIERRKQFMVSELKILEKERERIAQNIHDSTGPNLSVLKMNLETLAIKNTGSREEIQNIITQLDQIVTELRGFSHDLMPVSLRRKGIEGALADLCKKFTNSGLFIDLESDSNIELSNDISIQIYRIVEEFIFNSVKYSKAKRILIRLKKFHNKMTILLKDDGVGFDYEKSKDSLLSLGVKGFEYRTEILGGTFSYYSEPNQGVELNISFPNV